jgi:hypothetical protein
MTVFLVSVTRWENLTPDCSLAPAVVFEILFLVKLLTPRDDSATVGNSLENCFPEYLAVMSRCSGYKQCQKIFVSSGYFLILERAKNRRGYDMWIRWMVHFVTDFLARNLRTLNTLYKGALSWWRIHLSGQSSDFFLWTGPHVQFLC